MKKLIKSALLFLIIPGILFIFWLVGSLFLSSKYSFSVLIQGLNNSAVIQGDYSELHKGEIIRGQFTANNNNMGIISVRFNTFNRINDDVVIFRLKEKQSARWFYEHKYKVDQFQPNQLFTFGFPIITDSQGKTHVFEVESTKGENRNAVALSTINPVFVAQYQFPREELIRSPITLITFIINKLISSFSDINFSVVSMLYSLPFVHYIVWLILFRKKHLVNPFLLILYVIGLVFFIFFMQEVNRIVVFLLLLMWLMYILLYRLESSVSFFLALVLLGITPIFLAFKFDRIADNLALWVYNFLMIGTLQAIVEFWRKPKKMVTYNRLLALIFNKLHK